MFVDRMGKMLIWSLGAAIFNVLFFHYFRCIEFPLFMDSIGTALVAALFGPAAGVGTALLTHLGLEMWSGFEWLYAPWVLCSISTALIIGGAVRLNRFSSVSHLVIVVLLVSFVNALCGALLHTLLYGGFADHSTDRIVRGFQLLTGDLLWASFWARVPLNIVDKGLAVLIAFILSRRLSDEA